MDCPRNKSLSLLRFLLVSVGCLTTVLADDLIVYEETVGSHTTVQRRTIGGRREQRDARGEVIVPATPSERQTRSTTHKLVLVVSLLPRETVVDASSVRLVSEKEKKVQC